MGVRGSFPKLAGSPFGATYRIFPNALQKREREEKDRGVREDPVRYDAGMVGLVSAT